MSTFEDADVDELAGTPRRQNIVMRYLSRFDEGEALRWAFRGLLVGTITVLALDLRDLGAANGWWWTQDAATASTSAEPILPPVVTTDTPLPSADPRQLVTTGEEVLRQPMSFVLAPGGVLTATGSIAPGTAARLEAELAARGEYVKTVSLNSPGGALDDAMAMAKAVRQRGLTTEVADGALCASSCPLLFAGGKKRLASEKAVIGVHQFYAASAAPTEPAQAMADAQATTARISRHLTEMGVDPALWLHALDTPPRALYYFTPKELASYRLVTGPAVVARK